MKHKTYLEQIAHKLKMRPLGLLGISVLAIFVFIALYAPFLASSKPLCVVYDGTTYFPLFRYLFSSLFYSKKIDLFFNILGVLLPFYFACSWASARIKLGMRLALGILLAALFVIFGFFVVLDPAISPHLNQQKEALILQLGANVDDEAKVRVRSILPSWDIDLEYMNSYAKLNLVLNAYNKRATHEALVAALHNPSVAPYSLYSQEQLREKNEKERLQKYLEEHKQQYIQSLEEEERVKEALLSAPANKIARLHKKSMQLEEENEAYEEEQNRLQFIQDRREWITRHEAQISFILMPLLSNYHWEDDVGGEQALNLKLPFTHDTRVNRKDLCSALIFGCRISLFVGFVATLLALAIGVPLGLISGYYGSKLDIAICRFVEVWEAMPVFFMLLLVVSILQTKSIFVVIAVISVFSWMGSFRFVRAETFRQRELLYIDASRAIGFPDSFILFRHILPNSILAVLALLPFDIMAAVTREAALAFLGLGEEQSCSWGVLMDEGRSAFPADSDLLWPPAIVLTILLVAIAFVGQALQAAMDPKSEE